MVRMKCIEELRKIMRHLQSCSKKSVIFVQTRHTCLSFEMYFFPDIMFILKSLSLQKTITKILVTLYCMINANMKYHNGSWSNFIHIQLLNELVNVNDRKWHHKIPRKKHENDGNFHINVVFIALCADIQKHERWWRKCCQDMMINSLRHFKLERFFVY